MQAKSEHQWRNERSKKKIPSIYNLSLSMPVRLFIQRAQSLFGSSIRRKTARKFLPPFLCTFFPSSVQVPRRLTMTSPTCQKKIRHTLTGLRKLFFFFFILVTHFPSRPPSRIVVASVWHSVLFADKQQKVKRAERLSNAAWLHAEVGLELSLFTQRLHKMQDFTGLIALHNADSHQLPSHYSVQEKDSQAAIHYTAIYSISINRA